HREGARARMEVEHARAAVAALIGATPAEIVFTSGATEANNLALRGALALRPGALVTTAIEHSSIVETARALEAAGATIRVVGADPDGRISADAVIAACDAQTTLVSVGLANSEIGTIGPIAEVAQALAGGDVLVHTDAAQAAGRIPVDVHALGVHLASLSAHKLGGPTGVGALWIRHGVALAPTATGGPQEQGRRGGTENVAGIVGFGIAARVVRSDLDAAARRIAALRDKLWAGIHAAL